MDQTGKHKENIVVLVVDDDATIRMLVRETLEPEGFMVHEAVNGSEALSVLSDIYPDLILLDVVMPEMDGFKTCEEMRKIQRVKLIPILMMTALEDICSINRAYEVGATDFITKPMNWTILYHRILYMLRSYHVFQRLQNREASLVNAQQIAKLGNWEWNPTDDHMYWSNELFRLFGIKDRKITPTFELFMSLMHPQDKEFITSSIDRIIREKTDIELDHSIVLRNGSEKFVNHHIQRVNNEAPDVTLLAGIIQDITERKKTETKIHQLAYYDSLTKLPNRLSFKKTLAHEIETAKRNNHKFAVLYLDIDNFKHINDTYGHDTGDKLLVSLAERLTHSIRTIDYTSRAAQEGSPSVISRIGGDEYIILLKDVKDDHNAATVAKRLIDSLSEPFIVSGIALHITTSIGISVYNSDNATMEMILKNADMAMYSAKNSGKNNFRFSNKEMHTAAMERINLINAMREAIANMGFDQYYQPKVNISDGRIIGIEALIRWNHPERGFIPPCKFIPIAEESDLIEKIGEWVLLTACQTSIRLQNSGYPPLPMAVNISYRQLIQRKFVSLVSGILNQTGLQASLLEIELTENVLVKQDAVHVLNDLKDLGIKLSIDDFGTGWSSLNYLKKLPIDSLKIDQSFMHNIPTDKGNSSIVKAIILLAHSLELHVIAEGVEKEVQRDYLYSCGCREAQGFLFSKPVRFEEFISLLQKQFLP
ncbi:MAG: EAL domain-containing protein [Syntrophales bacterium]